MYNGIRSVLHFQLIFTTINKIFLIKYSRSGILGWMGRCVRAHAHALRMK